MARTKKLTGNVLVTRYVPLHEAAFWDDNPKQHDMHALVRSIVEHGFRDAPLYDATLGGIIAGNGRTLAVQYIHQIVVGDTGSNSVPLPIDLIKHVRDALNDQPPIGIATDNEGEWYVPMQFGIDSSSIAAAKSFGVSHNNLTMPRDVFAFNEVAQLWDEAAYAELILELRQNGEVPIGMTSEEIDNFLRDIDERNDPTEVEYDGSYEIIVACTDEGSQATLLNELMKRGYECRALM